MNLLGWWSSWCTVRALSRPLGRNGIRAGLKVRGPGSRIPEWTGAKSSPVALGLLTMALSLLAAAAALRQRKVALTTGRRTACAVMILGTGLVCSTTVGWLWWWLPAPLLFATGALTVDSGRDSLRVIGDHWASVLLRMVRSQAMWLWTLSTDSPTRSVLTRAKSACFEAKVMNSLVQTGVKSPGWENSTTQRPA